MILPRIFLGTLLAGSSLALWASNRPLQSVDASRLVAAAQAQLREKLGAESASARLTVIGKPEDVRVPPGVLDLQVHSLKGRWPRARVGVPVDIRVAGRVVQTATVWFALDIHRRVLGYAANAEAGASAASLQWVSNDADVTLLTDSPITDPREVQGMRLRHPVAADAIATRGDFERVPDVDSHERVQVQVLARSIRMQARGTAAARGNVGDVVPVLVDQAEAPVHARVIAKGVVEVVE